jgi:multiple sugar transport system ATP-binding protein
MTMADRIVVMNGGRIEQIGAPLHLYDRPSNRFVAGFIGSPAMNFIDCQYSGGALQIIGSNLTIPVSSAMAEGPVVLGIRPEHVELAQNGLPARVEVVEPTGSETQVISSLGEQTLICLFKERLEIRHGTQINLAFPLEKLHFFDAKTGDAIDMEADHETLHDDSSD